MIDLKPLPMEEAQQFWRSKVSLPPGQFQRLADDAKTRAFAVSGIAKGNELSTVFQSLQRGIDEGTSFGDFKRDCAEIFGRRGWTGMRAWRVDNIFRTNIQTAYNVGRYRQMTEVSERRPYWQYSAVNDSRTRPTHAALNGRVFPADSPFWDTWYPPNGFRCRCGVVTLSPAEVRARGLNVEKDDPTGRLIEPIDPETGYKLPARLLMPDPGFAHNPGRSVWGGIADAAGKPGKWDELPDLPGPAAYRRPALGNVRPAEIGDINATQLLPAGKSDEFYKGEFLSRFGEEKVVRDAIGEPAILSLRAFLADKSPGVEASWKFSKAGHGEFIPMMEGVLIDPFEIWLTPQRNPSGQVRLTKRYVALWKTEDRERIGGIAVYEVADGVFQGVTAFLPHRRGEFDLGYVERQRRGLLLYGKGR